MPAVSVVMVFHRDQPFLRPAIASVLRQTWRDFELVLVDNGAGLTVETLGPAGADARVRWVRLGKNEGIPAGHNAGIAVARGELVALLDYDDVALPTRLEKQVARLRANGAVDFVSTLAARIDEHGQRTGRVFCLPDASGHRDYALYAAPVVTPAGMGRREVFERFPYRAEFPFAADLDFQARVTDRGKMEVIPEELLNYRWYPAQTTQQRAVSIEQSRAAIQLVTARRRAGRAEDLSGALAAVAVPTAAEAWRRAARVSVAEGFVVPAAYQVRRSLAFGRSPGALMRAGVIFARAWARASAAERGQVGRMFGRGPVKALGLRPA